MSQEADHIIEFISSLSTLPEHKEKSTTIDQNIEQRYYISTVINHVDRRPNIQHIYEAITGDIIARYHRIYGRKVFFLTGADEYGGRVVNISGSCGFTPKQLCDNNISIFQQLNNMYQISNDCYLRTTDKKHFKLVSEIFSMLYNNGDIYLGNINGWYCSREQRFITDTKARDRNYLDPVTRIKYVQRSEDVYLFRISKYHDKIINYIKQHPSFIQPEQSRKTILNRLNSDKLEDLRVSRNKIDWSIPVPFNNTHSIAAWFTSLCSYLTGIDYFDNDENLNIFSPANVHIIGKDVAWFHAVIWSCILMSCNISLPKHIFCHGFILGKHGYSMCMNIGNIIDPFDILKKYNSDSI
eukprot:192356_1